MRTCPGPNSIVQSSTFSRREFLWRFGGGLGGIALTSLLGEQRVLAENGPHFPARAKRVIQLFMNGGASQMDLFDHKPELVKRHGEKFDPGTGEHVEAATRNHRAASLPFSTRLS